MSKKDTYKRTFPIKIRYGTSDLADSSRLTGFQKQLDQSFRELERAIGDIYNTENATNSVLSSDALYINSLGRSIGSMANIVPPLSGVEEFSPTLASRLAESTYNVIPHPEQAIKCEVGCKFDSLERPDSTERTCLKGLTAYYRQIEGEQSTICQNTSCPGWSGRPGQTVNTEICDPNAQTAGFREYKLVMPSELRTVDNYSVKYYSNAGASSYDTFRTDRGERGFGINRTDPSDTYALVTNATEVSGVSAAIRYSYPSLESTADYIVVLEVPALDVGQVVEINDINFGNVNGNSNEPSRFLYDLSSFESTNSVEVAIRPNADTDGLQAAVSQVWLIEKNQSAHRNFNEPLLLPKVLDTLTPGAEIPANFVQIFDSNIDVNRVLDKTRYFKTRFEPLGPGNRFSNRDAVDVTLFDSQELEVNNNRYHVVTVGTDVATAVGALLEAFVDHVSDTNIHLTEETICQLLQDRSFCCEDRFFVQLNSLTPSNRRAGAAPTIYRISAFVYGGIPPYTVTINWGDNSEDTDLGIVSGIQEFTLEQDFSPENGAFASFEHIYDTKGTYDVTFDVIDDPTVFGCTGTLTNLVSPFNVGSPPSIDLEVRLDQVTDYPNHVFSDVDAGYNFTTTENEDFDTANARFHTLTQVHSSDDEDGKPTRFSWIIDNPNGLSYQFYYENVSGVIGETLSMVNFSGSLSNDFVQQDSLAVKTPTGQVLVQDVDYTVDWVSGVVTTTPGLSVSGTLNLTVNYYHYQFASTLSDITVDSNRWIALGDETAAATINLNTLTNRVDLNTVRFKSREF